LLAAMEESRQARLIRAAAVLGQAAALLGVPVLVTEQYPKGLGNTVGEISRVLPDDTRRFEKTCFSACGASDFLANLHSNQRSQVVLIGMETHVCILQTAFDLLAADFEVFVVEDGVCSRVDEHKANALERMARAGVTVTNLESVLFEWLGDAAHPHFKAISALIR
jgi:hypothetical protein